MHGGINHAALKNGCFARGSVSRTSQGTSGRVDLGKGLSPLRATRSCTCATPSTDGTNNNGSCVGLCQGEYVVPGLLVLILGLVAMEPGSSHVMRRSPEPSLLTLTAWPSAPRCIAPAPAPASGL